MHDEVLNEVCYIQEHLFQLASGDMIATIIKSSKNYGIPVLVDCSVAMTSLECSGQRKEKQ